jgi:hypothetical protein
VLEDLVYILNTGRVPEGSKLEWFADGARLLGGDHSQSLGEFGLVEADSATPFASPKIEHMMVKRDGSAYQYQGAGNFRATQTFKARTGIALTDNRNPAQHGKGSADGASNVATGTLKAGVEQNHTLEPGTRNVVLYLASVTSSPPISSQTAFVVGVVVLGTDMTLECWCSQASHHKRPLDHNRKANWWTHTHYLYCYVAEQAIKRDLASAEKGYSGSSRDHQYMSRGLSVGDSELLHRESVCACMPCITGRPDQCLFARSVPTGVLGRCRIRAAPVVEARATRGGGGRG